MAAAGGYSFGPYQLQTAPLRLRRTGVVLALSPRHLAILHEIVSRAGEIVPKDELIAAGWRSDSVSVGDGSLRR